MLSGSYPKAEVSKVSLDLTCSGGLQPVNTVLIWSMGLHLLEESWSVLDRKYIGIWKLINENRNDFHDSSKLAEIIREAWDTMKGVDLESSTVLSGGAEATPQEIRPNLVNTFDLLKEARDAILPKILTNPREATGDLATLVFKLRETLKACKDNHQHAFLITMTQGLGYDKSQMHFRSTLTQEQLSNFCTGLEVAFQAFCRYASDGKMQLEAYLVQLALEPPFGDKGSSTDRLMRVSVALEDFQCEISQEINEARNRFLPTEDWPGLTVILEKLMNGDRDAINKKPEPIIIEDIEHIHSNLIPTAKTAQLGSKFLNVSEKEKREPPQARQRALLEQLGLLDFYPRKIKLNHVIAINKGNKLQQDKFDLVDIPLAILRRFIMIDYRGRNTAWERQLTGDTSSGHVDDDFLNSIMAGFDDGSTSENIPNPLDIFLATFSCCDLMLCQVILEKMNMCRLAVPFVMPTSSHGTNLTLCLWSLRSIVVECANESTAESALVECPMKVVSFVRIGESSLSKSQLLNEVLNGQSHHTFFSKESCSLGTSARTISCGLIEAAWYLPSRKESDILDSVTMFLNLRGNAFSFKRQLSLISSISAVVTVVVDMDSLGKSDTIAALHTMFQSKVKAILLLTSCSSAPNMQTVRQQLRAFIDAIGESNMASLTTVFCFKAGKQKTLPEIRHEIHQKLSAISKASDHITMENIVVQSEALLIDIDENDHFCDQGKQFATSILVHTSNMSLTDVKSKLLPIQKDIWPQWSKLLKKQHRTTGKDRKTPSATEEEQLGHKMARLRAEQLDRCRTLTPLLKAFIDILCQTIENADLVQMVLQWLKLYFDKKSRDDLPGLRKQYNKLWAELKAAKGKTVNDPKSVKELEERVRSAEISLAEASCGLEHLLREVGQLYEASKDSNVPLAPNTQRVIDQLPMIAAKLILLGHPIEFMDGDAANVPLTWVQAILTNLASLTGEKRVFVLSVLGIQSSGKSTLLNTMFGLRFAVSAGRCTRGVYVQLVEVDRSETGLPFDYIMVVDTEGLRAPELCHDKHEHDNELATLAIGLGDAVFLNIKGENMAEMKDVLQIAVHAFLRMKVVNVDIKLQQTCVFIHQNVSAANAKQKMVHGRQSLLDNLDKMAKEAADLERLKGIQSFSQVIDIDVNKSVWYFSDLWQGDPPMAPTNPGYSESVQSVKEYLLYEVSKQKESNFLSVSNLKKRIQDIWKGILADDFVFSFRNSLAVKAYSGLEDKYQEVAWVIEQSVMKWYSETASIKLKRCETEEALETTTADLLNELETLVEDHTAEQQRELEEFFQKNPLQEIIIQWKAEKAGSLQTFADQIVRETKTAICQKKGILVFELNNRTKQDQLSQIIVVKASQLADDMKGKSYDEGELRPKFNEMWTRWISELAPPIPPSEIPISVIVESILWDRLRAYSPALRIELKKHRLDKSLGTNKLSGSFSVTQLASNDISEKRTITSRVTSTIFGDGGRWDTCKHHILVIVQKAFGKIDVYLNNLLSKDTGFQQSFATVVIKMVTDEVKKHTRMNAERDEFTLTSTFIVKLAVHVCRHAVAVFTKLSGDYIKRHSQATKLQEFNETAFNMFWNKVKNCTNERIAADLFFDRLKELIKTKIEESMPFAVIDDTCTHFVKKYHLIIAILEELANTGNFDNFKSYIQDSKVHALKWLTTHINRKFFLRQNGVQTKYAEMAEVQLKQIIKGVKEGIRYASNRLQDEEAGNMQQWLKYFCDGVESVLPVRELQMITVTQQGVSDLSNFQNLLLDQDRLTLLEHHILESFQAQTDAIKWKGMTPYQKVLDRLWGCGAQCPFCNEPCQWMDPDHWNGRDKKVSHQCIQHRPGAIGGDRWDSDCCVDHNQQRMYKDQLSTESCHYSVQWKDVLFSCRDAHYECRKQNRCTCTDTGRGEYHTWVDYKSVLPDWDIAPSSTNENAKYWMWFLKTYKYQLKDLYKAKLPNIPKSWESITKDKAIESLRVSF
ncbi:interferon-induced very large GTPase 1-like [Lineus longissimus]|uniref:interferon-induced very large GTPase 1-like n=1 Tax=Lineus longissimus TaxID=88925 RepID=UPI00315D27DF